MSFICLPASDNFLVLTKVATSSTATFSFVATVNRVTEKGQVENFLCACPLMERCNCKRQAKILIHPTVKLLNYNKQQTVQKRICEQDRGKYLMFAICAEVLDCDCCQGCSPPDWIRLIRVTSICSRFSNQDNKSLWHWYKSSVD
jgi:hypothetical protein